MSEVRVHATFEVTDVEKFLLAAKAIVTATQVILIRTVMCGSEIYCRLRRAVSIMNCSRRMGRRTPTP